MIKPMEISGTSPGGVSATYKVERVVDGVDKQVSKVNQDGPADGAVGDAASADPSGNSLSSFGALSANKEKINQQANDIHGLGEARILVDRVQASLEVVVKSFPPFPPGSLEREQFLTSVAGIRSIIEQLTFPPDQKQRVSESLSGPAFTNAEATDPMLSNGLEELKKINSDLSGAQKKLSGEVSFLGGNQGDESFYVSLSEGVGLALQQQHANILKDPKQLLDVLS